MKDATLAQGNQIMNLILQQKTSTEHLQKILNLGLITDILKSDPEKVNRWKVQAALGLLPTIGFVMGERWFLRIDRKTPFSKLLGRSGLEDVAVNTKGMYGPGRKFTLADDVATDEKFSLSLETVREFRLAFFQNQEQKVSPWDLTEFEIKHVLEGYGFVHGDARSLLAFAQIGNAPINATIVAFGTESDVWHGDFSVTGWSALEWCGKRWLFNPHKSDFRFEKDVYFLVSH